MNNLSDIKKDLKQDFFEFPTLWTVLQIQRPMYNVHGLKNKITNIARIAKLP